MIKPPPKPRRAVSRNGNAAAAIANVGIGTNIGTNRIPVPNSNLFVDSGWYGTIVVETEGTNESLADLQTRCGPGAFPPRTMAHPPTQREKENMFVWRIIREKRCVSFFVGVCACYVLMRTFWVQSAGRNLDENR